MLFFERKQSTYIDCFPEKLECISFNQKLTDSRFSQKIKDLKGKLLNDVAKIYGKRRLTNSSINPLKNFFGMPIRQNKINLLSIRNFVIAKRNFYTIVHSFHKKFTPCQFYLKCKNSWCKWQLEKVNLPVAIAEEGKPTKIYQTLQCFENVSMG